MTLVKWGLAVRYLEPVSMWFTRLVLPQRNVPEELLPIGTMFPCSYCGIGGLGPSISQSDCPLVDATPCMTPAISWYQVELGSRVLLCRVTPGEGWNVRIGHEKFQLQTISPERKPDRGYFLRLMSQSYTSKYIQASSKEKERNLACVNHPAWIEGEALQQQQQQSIPAEAL